MDLYEALGVKKGTSHEDVRKAYRKLSKKHHPDAKDGDAERFTEIKRAHDILIDDERRARYDRTGDVSEKVPEGNADAELYNFVTQIMLAVLQNNFDVEHTDLTKNMAGLLGQNKSQATQQRDLFKDHVGKLEKVKLRLVKKEGDNILGTLLTSQIQMASGKVDMCNKQIEIIERAEKMLSDYTYTYDSVGRRTEVSNQLFHHLNIRNTW